MAARKSVALPRAPCNPHRQGLKSCSPFENEEHGSLVEKKTSLVGKKNPHSGRKKTFKAPRRASPCVGQQELFAVGKDMLSQVFPQQLMLIAVKGLLPRLTGVERSTLCIDGIVHRNTHELLYDKVKVLLMHAGGRLPCGRRHVRRAVVGAVVGLVCVQPCRYAAHAHVAMMIPLDHDFVQNRDRPRRLSEFLNRGESCGVEQDVEAPREDCIKALNIFA